MQKIVKWTKKHPFSVGLLIVVLIFIVTSVIRKQNEEPTWTTDTVSTGIVRNLVSVSGSVEAVGSAELSFSSGGIIETILVKEGDVIEKGQVLATLRQDDLRADYADADAALRIATADQDELISGLRPEARDIAQTEYELAQEELTRVKREQDELVKNAYTKLLSDDLQAFPKKRDTTDPLPAVTGTYTCGEGTYTLNIYRSGANSGFSYVLSGLETGTYNGYTDAPGPLGTCGLNIQFSDNASYANSIWTIEIPNKNSASYITNQNAYLLVKTQRENAIREAEQNLKLAEQNLALDTALPRSEATQRSTARIAQAQAKLASISAQIRDHVLVAPFDGTITNIDPVVGESIGTNPVVTIVSDDAFALTALIPEIDVTKVTIGQKAEVVFDARQGEILSAHVIFLSPLAKVVDGVSYFEAKLTLDGAVDWLRSGLNADVDIIIDQRENVTRIPKRYLVDTDGKKSVLIPNDKATTAVPVEVVFTGNDGLVAVTGIDVGSTIVAP